MQRAQRGTDRHGDQRARRRRQQRGRSALRRTLSVRAHDDYLRQRLSAVWVHVVHLPNRKQRDCRTERFERGTTSRHLQRQ